MSSQGLLILKKVLRENSKEVENLRMQIAKNNLFSNADHDNNNIPDDASSKARSCSLSVLNYLEEEGVGGMKNDLNPCQNSEQDNDENDNNQTENQKEIAGTTIPQGVRGLKNDLSPCQNSEQDNNENEKNQSENQKVIAGTTVPQDPSPLPETISRVSEFTPALEGNKPDPCTGCTRTLNEEFPKDGDRNFKYFF